jgi:hypothetical protein
MVDVVGNTAASNTKIMESTTNPIVKTRKARTRETVLIKVTAQTLADLIGTDEIGVSRKELRQLVLKKSSTDVLSAAGL